MDVICIDRLTKVYKALDFWKNDRTVGVDNLTLNIKKGEVFGLLGLNGAGKTTLMKILLGLLKPTSGTVTILGSSINDEKVRARIGYLPELPYFPKYLKAKEVLSYFADILGIPADKKEGRISEVLEVVRLTNKADTRIKGFSKGMQGRLALAQSILNDPEVLFLDEPMSGLDPLGYKETRDIILDLNRRGRTIFFNSHILSEVEKVCNRIGVLHAGKLIDVQPAAKAVKKYRDLENYFIHMVGKGGVK